jgi:hemolysin III
MSAHPVVNYDPVEERINFISHAIGAGLALIAGILLIIKGSYLETAQWIGLWVYALSLFLLFAASSLYHFAESPERRGWYKKLDHTAIYYLIAGTYTPFLSIALPTQKAHYLLIALWVIALIGTLFKLVFIHRFEKISLIAYLLMGWLAVLVMDDMLTDTIRALLLKAYGYETKVFEFVALEHTSKNKMILATKRKDYQAPDVAVLAQIQALKEMYGIQKHSLELLLNNQWDQQDVGYKC